jgi:enamine deaminase RidA (YjgF/YER057c/UK114 family)
MHQFRNPQSAIRIRRSVLARTIIAPPFIHKSVGYSHAVQVGNTLYIAGQVGVDPEGNVVGSDIEAQVAQVWRNLKSILGYAGGTLEDIVKITTFTTDIAYRPAIGAARDAMFPNGRYPASTFLVVKGLARPELLVEIEAIAVLGG